MSSKELHGIKNLSQGVGLGHLCEPRGLSCFKRDVRELFEQLINERAALCGEVGRNFPLALVLKQERIPLGKVFTRVEVVGEHCAADGEKGRREVGVSHHDPNVYGKTFVDSLDNRDEAAPVSQGDAFEPCDVVDTVGRTACLRGEFLKGFVDGGVDGGEIGPGDVSRDFHAHHLFVDNCAPDEPFAHDRVEIGPHLLHMPWAKAVFDEQRASTEDGVPIATNCTNEEGGDSTTRERARRERITQGQL